MNRIIMLASLLLLAYSCEKRKIEKLTQIPSELHGEWIDEIGEFKIEISTDKVVRYDITIENDESPLISVPIEIFYVNRAKCEDCAEWAIKLIFKNLEQDYYLDSYHPLTKKYNTLKIVDSLVNPHTGRSEQFPTRLWKRIE